MVTGESAEVIEAAEQMQVNAKDSREHFVHECADLIYHLFVLMAHQDVSLDDVQDELARRFGTSGIDEKESRTKAPE